MRESLARIWARASNVERFLLVVIPPCIVWDVLNGNLLDLIVSVTVACWLIWDLHREGDRG